MDQPFTPIITIMKCQIFYVRKKKKKYYIMVGLIKMKKRGEEKGQFVICPMVKFRRADDAPELKREEARIKRNGEVLNFFL